MKSDNAVPCVRLCAVQILIQRALFSCIFKIHRFSNNNDEGNGGGIRTEIKTDVCVEKSRFIANEADVLGGAIYNKGKLDLRDIVFGENTATMVCLNVLHPSCLRVCSLA